MDIVMNLIHIGISRITGNVEQSNSGVHIRRRRIKGKREVDENGHLAEGHQCGPT